MRNLAAVGGVLVATAVSMLLHLVTYGYFVVQICGESDTANRFPANASTQGWVCGAYAPDAWYVPGVWVLGFSTIMGVAAAVWIWSRGGAWPWASPFGLLTAPLMAIVLLGLPPDECTRTQLAEHGTVECRTTPIG